MNPAPNTRPLIDRLGKPEFEILCEIGFAYGAMQLARLEHKGRSVWKTRRIAEKHAREYTQVHGRVAYVSEA